jgi:hypothetical protein
MAIYRVCTDFYWICTNFYQVCTDICWVFNYFYWIFTYFYWICTNFYQFCTDICRVYKLSPSLPFFKFQTFALPCFTAVNHKIPCTVYQLLQSSIKIIILLTFTELSKKLAGPWHQFYHFANSLCFFWYKQVLDQGPEQRESNLTLLCLLIIIILIK